MRTDKPLFGFSRKPMPKQCPDCGQTMSEVQTVRFNLRPGTYDNKQTRSCTCGCMIVWSYPNVFKRRHVLPLFDDGKVLGHA